jgi:ribonuclease HI
MKTQSHHHPTTTPTPTADQCLTRTTGHRASSSARIQRAFATPKPIATDIAVHVTTCMRSDPGPGAWAARIVTKERSGTNSGYYPVVTGRLIELDAIVSVLRIVEYLPGTLTVHNAPLWIAECLSDGRAKEWRANGWYTSNRTPVRYIQWWEELIRLYELRDSTVHWANHVDEREMRRCLARASVTLAEAKYRRNSQWRGGRLNANQYGPSVENGEC